VRSLDAEVAELQRDAFGTTSDNWTIDHAFHCGGFAKCTPELDGFIADFHRRHGVDLDWVYVAKIAVRRDSVPVSGTGSLPTVIMGPATVGHAWPRRRGEHPGNSRAVSRAVGQVRVESVRGAVSRGLPRPFFTDSNQPAAWLRTLADAP